MVSKSAVGPMDSSKNKLTLNSNPKRNPHITLCILNFLSTRFENFLLKVL